jgi:hypothetical protein
MNTQLFIKYVGSIEDRTSEIPLSDLGQSLIAFEEILDDLSHVCRIDGKLQISATAEREGSHIVDLILRLSQDVNSLPFDSPTHLLEFLRITNQEAWAVARQFFSAINNAHATLNDYAARYPIDFAIFSAFVILVIKKIGLREKKPLQQDKDIPERIAIEVQRIINKNAFRKLIQPIIVESVNVIEVSSDRHFKSNSSKISDSNFEDFCGEDSEILPDLINGQECILDGIVRSLKSTRGDSLTLGVERDGKEYNLDVFPEQGKTTKAYTPYYQELVRLKGIVDRASLFKRSKIKMISIEKVQTSLNLEIGSTAS